MLRLASSCQMLADRQLEEVEGRVQAVLVELKLAAKLLDLTLTCRHQNLLTPGVGKDNRTGACTHHSAGSEHETPSQHWCGTQNQAGEL